MRILINERLSEHKYKTPEGYLICTDAIIARTGKQEYRKNEIFADSDDDSIIELDRPANEVFSEKTIASFENKPLVNEHPDEDVNTENYKDYAVGFIRDVHKGIVDGQDVLLANLVFTDKDAIDDIESGRKTELSCGYDCDIVDEANPKQTNIRGNHVALCERGRAGIAKIVDSMKDSKETEVKNWWKEVETANLKERWGYYIDNSNSTIDEMVSAMFDMLKELKTLAPELYRKGKPIYNKYTQYSRYNDTLVKDWSMKYLGHTIEEVFFSYNDDGHYCVDGNKDKRHCFETLEEAKAYIRSLRKRDSINDVEPKVGESKEDFISRFMSETKEEYPDEKQRLAVAYSYWKKGKGTDAMLKDSLTRQERELCDYMLENAYERGMTPERLWRKMLVYYSEYASLARSKKEDVLDYFEEEIENGMYDSTPYEKQTKELEKSEERFEDAAPGVDEKIFNEICENEHKTTDVDRLNYIARSYNANKRTMYQVIYFWTGNGNIAYELSQKLNIRDSVRDATELSAKSIDDLEEQIKHHEKLHPTWKFGEIRKDKGLYRVDVIKDSIQDDRFGEIRKVANKNEIIRGLKSIHLDNQEDDLWLSDGTYDAQIQNRGLTSHEFRKGVNKLSEKEASWALGRIWKNGDMVFKEDGPINVVRDKMIKYLQSINDSIKDDEFGEIRKVANKNGIIRGLKAFYLDDNQQGDLWLSDGTYDAQIQNRGLITTGFNGNWDKAFHKGPSYAVGRIWKNDNLIFKEKGSVNVVRDKMIKYLQSTNDSIKDTKINKAIKAIKVIKQRQDSKIKDVNLPKRGQYSKDDEYNFYYWVLLDILGYSRKPTFNDRTATGIRAFPRYTEEEKKETDNILNKNNIPHKWNQDRLVIETRKANKLYSDSVEDSKVKDVKAKDSKYEFPKLNQEDILKAKRYNLTLVGHTGDGTILKGALSDIKKYADEYLGYEINEEYLDSKVKDEYVRTPRGTFLLVNKTEEELKKEGYSYHHSGNGYKVFIKNNKAVAIK